MAARFRLQQVSQRLSGGEIVRTRDLGPGPVTVGRATDCDVAVPDLAVALRQLSLAALPDGTVLLRRLSEAPLLLDGQPAESGRLPLDRPRVLGLGRFRLTIERPADSSAEVHLRLETDAAERASAEKLTPPVRGRRAASWGLGLALFLAALAAPVAGFLARPLPPAAETEAALAAEPHYRQATLRADRAWLSGGLSDAHAPLVSDCKACHQAAFESVTDAACRRCHISAHDHADPSRLLAAMAAPPPLLAAARAAAGLPPGRCTACHTEHEGPVLRSNPATAGCAGCHADLDARLPDTALRNAADWRRDHPQFRPLVVAGFAGGTPRLVRVSLDARPEDRNGLVFSHAQHLSRTNAVARMAGRLPGYGRALGCADCHRPESGGGFRPIEMERDCGACHSLAIAVADGRIVDLPHGEPRRVVATLLALAPAAHPRPAVAGAARRVPGSPPPSAGLAPSAAARAAAPFHDGGLCRDCHGVSGESAPGRLDFAIAPVHLTDRFYARSLFPHDRHEDMRCASCHAAEMSVDAGDLLLPAIAICRDCHGNARWAARNPGAEASGACTACHWFHPDRRAPGFAELEKSVRGAQGRRS